ncbi:hypothetical protein Scep_021971 [Stephania cephalantha]|uniref:Uncharacterized protein n=1 Tax=Stephania cephalantha TaxID=152367 RepID=A0AAP0F747_9MAGN
MKKKMMLEEGVIQGGGEKYQRKNKIKNKKWRNETDKQTFSVSFRSRGRGRPMNPTPFIKKNRKKLVFKRKKLKSNP